MLWITETLPLMSKYSRSVRVRGSQQGHTVFAVSFVRGVVLFAAHVCLTHKTFISRTTLQELTITITVLVKLSANGKPRQLLRCLNSTDYDNRFYMAALDFPHLQFLFEQEVSSKSMFYFAVIRGHEVR